LINATFDNNDKLLILNNLSSFREGSQLFINHFYIAGYMLVATQLSSFVNFTPQIFSYVS